MSGFAAIFNLDGRPVDRDLLSRMIHAVPYRGPDGIHTWADGSVGLGHAMMCTTPESLHETQPLPDDSAGLVLTMDGRVDNREELSARLTSKGYRLRDDTDAELVMRAYECWGDDSPEKIIGDFAYVIWDARRRRLFCARDPIGVKPFFYYIDREIFVAATEIQQILKHPAIKVTANEKMVALYLAVQQRTSSETLFKEIRRLPRAHCMAVSGGDGSVQPKKYFDICATKRIRYGSDDEYGAHFREVLTQSVRSKIRSAGPVGSRLSGGLDSSAVVGIAQDLITRGESSLPDLETFSMIFDEPESDERPYIEEVLKMWRVKSNYVRPLIPDRQSCERQVKHYRYLPTSPTGFSSISLKKLAPPRGIRVLLSGFGGDEWFAGTNATPADLLRQMKFSAFISSVRTDLASRVPMVKPTFVPVARRALSLGPWPWIQEFAPPRTVRAIERLVNRRAMFPSWMSKDMIRQIDAVDGSEYNCPCGHHETLAARISHREYLDTWVTEGLEMEDRSSACAGIEERNPFLDRRVMEFGFAIPEDQRFRNRRTKIAFRNGMRCILPEPIRERDSKAGFSHLFAKAFVAVQGETFRLPSAIAAAGWVVPGELRRTYEEMISLYRQAKREYTFSMWSMWEAVAIDLWAAEML